MMNTKLKNSAAYIVFLIALMVISGCVDSIIDDQATTLKPTISITSPVAGTGASVFSGLNKIEYSASDYSGGQGLSFFQVILNDDVTTPNYEDAVTNGTLPELYLDVPRSFIGQYISYYVIVYNVAGGFAASDVQQNLLVKEAPPDAPLNLVIVPINITTGDIRLIWDDNSVNVVDYLIFQKIENGTWTQKDVVTAPQKTYSVRVNTIQDNYFKVAGWNSSVVDVSQLNFSNEVNTGSLINSWNLTAEAIGTSKVILRWDNPWGLAVNVFEIERTSGVVAWDEVPEFYIIGSSDSQIEYTDNSVTSNTSYAYRVRRRMLADDYRSAWSNAVSIGTSFTDAIPPTNFTAVAQFSNATSYQVSLDWDLSYLYPIEIERAQVTAFPPVYSVVHTVSAGTAGPFTDGAFVVGSSYYYRARYVLGSNVYSEYTSIITVP